MCVYAPFVSIHAARYRKVQMFSFITQVKATCTRSASLGKQELESGG